MMERKGVSFELKADGAGGIEGYGSVFGGVDTVGDTVDAGAFLRSLSVRKPKMLWQHDMSKPIGVWDDVAEDGKGLRLKGRFADTEKGREARALAEMGALGGLSIGFRTVRAEMRGDVRALLEVDLYEVSLVTIPADGNAVITGVKSLATEREVEAALRETGFSRAEAKAFIARGWGGVRDLRDAGAAKSEDDLRDAEGLKMQLATLLERIAK